MIEQITLFGLKNYYLVRMINVVWIKSSICENPILSYGLCTGEASTRQGNNGKNEATPETRWRYNPLNLYSPFKYDNSVYKLLKIKETKWPTGKMMEGLRAKWWKAYGQSDKRLKSPKHEKWNVWVPKWKVEHMSPDTKSRTYESDTKRGTYES